MASGASRSKLRHVAARAPALAALALANASCVPTMSTLAPAVTAAPVTSARVGSRPPAPRTATAPGPVAAAFAIEGRTGLDRLRGQDCLAQAIYYEARSESEDGQRAVAQVVLNRVRHPAWPNSICGVVYQGPLRPGGGCQFTFTCDGSLERRAEGIDWARARALAAEALAGRVYAPVGLSTHYHTFAVAPSWGPRLARTTVIGAHIFYRLPGAGGLPGAFNAAYAGTEPLPNPIRIFFGVRPGAPTEAPVPARAALPAPSAPTISSDIPQDPRWAATNLPESTVREEYRQSGQWRADAPAAITGAR
ncbi:MAG: cell wall hydrolase [Sphingomonas sp.]|nr:cell wall hydrolase [Sphingomonas sp.]